MKQVLKEKEEFKENGEFYTYKKSEVINDDGTIDKDIVISPSKISAKANYTKGKQWSYHYETSDPKVTVPAFVCFSLVFLLIGIVVLIISIVSKIMFLTIWSIFWIIFVIIFVIHNLVKNGKNWYQYYKNKRNK